MNNKSTATTPKDEFWSFLPLLNSRIVEATFKASTTLDDPGVLYDESRLSAVLKEWVEVLHSTQLDVIANIATIDPSKLPHPYACHHCDNRNDSQESPGSDARKSCDPVAIRRRLLDSVFFHDPFRLPPEVRTKARDLATLCFQTGTFGSLRNVAAKTAGAVHDVENDSVNGDPNSASLLSHLNGSARSNPPSPSPGSEGTSTHCDLSLSMHSSTSERHGFRLSEAPTLDSCSESGMAQSMSSSYGAGLINLDLRIEELPPSLSTEEGQLEDNIVTGAAGVVDSSSSRINHCLVVSEESAEPVIGGCKKMSGVGLRQDATEVGHRRSSTHDDLSFASPSEATTSVSWMPMVLRASSRPETSTTNRREDADGAFFVRCYFHILDLESAWEAVRSDENPRFETWSALAQGCSFEARMRLLRNSGADSVSDDDSCWVLKWLEEFAGVQSELLIGYLVL